MSHSPHVSLDLDPGTMHRLAARVAEFVVQHLATLREQPVYTTRTPKAALAPIAGPAPETGRDLDALLGLLREEVYAYSAREPHPGFLAYVPSCPTFPAVLGDWITSGFNAFGGVWPVAAGPGALELTVLDWFRSWLGMPAGTGGLLTSGGSAANVNALVAARHAAVGETPGRLERLTLYTSTQAHSSVVRAAWIAGIPRANVRSIEVDPEFRVVPSLMEEAIRRDREAGLLPFAVVANAGTTNTGAVDPLPALADLAESHGLWLHVDAAYGGFAALTDRGRALLRGIERADSVTLDPHKWLYVPFECGCLLARDPARLAQAFRILPEYLRDVEGEGEQVNFADLGEQLTRATRALKVWLPVQYYGLGAFRAAIDQALNLARHAEAGLRRIPSVEILAPVTLGVVCFRLLPSGAADPEQIDAWNEEVISRINAGGRFFVSSTRLNGRLAVRICVLGFRTTQDDIDNLVHTASGFS